MRRQPSVPQGYRAWLGDRGSLTRRLEGRCSAFRVRLLSQRRARANRDERVIWPRETRRLAWVREVNLVCRRTPVVFAHSVIDPKALRGAWRGLKRLGERPLGAALFADPRIRRFPLRYRKLNRGHPLYRRACAKLRIRPPYLWARRSLFTLRGTPILVTEVFLPGILRLAR
ncbi:MAG: chorismate lyase [Betaproteobacteria bacterium]|nr:chorismate lyase [Betaproteobacteria bacterium]